MTNGVFANWTRSALLFRIENYKIPPLAIPQHFLSHSFDLYILALKSMTRDRRGKRGRIFCRRRGYFVKVVALFAAAELRMCARYTLPLLVIHL